MKRSRVLIAQLNKPDELAALRQHMEIIAHFNTPDELVAFRQHMEITAHMPINEVNAGMRSLGIEPNQPLPNRLACLAVRQIERPDELENAVNEPTSKQEKSDTSKTSSALMEAVKNLLEPEFEVVGMFVEGHSLIEEAPALHPDVIVLDIGMSFYGLSVGQWLKQLMSGVKLIYLTMNQDPELAAKAFRGGASAYLLMTSAASELLHAIREVLRGRSYITPLMTKDLVGSFVQNLKHQPPPYGLTLRQKKVLQLLAEGRSMTEIAYLLNITPRTVAFHQDTIMKELQEKNPLEYYVVRLILADR
jgi:DNA-binding NarL/FixJ family response regulator